MRWIAPRSLGRWALWLSLLVLLVCMVGTLVWLAGRYEVSQVENRMAEDASDAVADIRNGLTRNVQSLQALQFAGQLAAPWEQEAASLLREHREWLRLEWRDIRLQLKSEVDTPFRSSVFGHMGTMFQMPEVVQACSVAQRQSGPGYSASTYVPQANGQGLEVMNLCLPVLNNGELVGFTVATYALNEILINFLDAQLLRSQEVSFTEADGTRLAMHGAVQRGARVFTAKQLLTLPGNTMVLRLDSWRAAPDLFPNVLTALVTMMAIALASVMGLLARDMRRRQRVESDLADALAFRKAMEDSLVTGLRARDSQGRITYCWDTAFLRLTGHQRWSTNMASDKLCDWPAMRRLEKASSRSLCAKTANDLLC